RARRPTRPANVSWACSFRRETIRGGCPLQESRHAGSCLEDLHGCGKGVRTDSILHRPSCPDPHRPAWVRPSVAHSDVTAASGPEQKNGMVDDTGLEPVTSGM